MPVDLSKIGLEGQESYATRMMLSAQSATMEANADKTALENEHTRRIDELNNVAQERLHSIINREPQSGLDPEELAQNMDSLASPLELVGDVYLAGGAMQDAQKLFEAASQIRKRESDIDNDKVLSQQRRLENILKGADIIGRRFGGAKNESEWELAKRETQADLENGVFTMEPEMFEQIKGMPFDPDAAAFFHERAISESDKASQELRRITNDRLERVAAVTASGRARANQLRERQLQEQERHNRVIEKNSGTKPSNAPNSDQLKSVKSVLKTTAYKDLDVEDIESDPEFAAAANYVASQAMQLVKSNSAMTWDTAVRQAILRAQQAGAFTNKGGVSRWFGFSRTPDDPDFTVLPVPEQKSQMQKGKYYLTARGLAKWDGKQFVME